VDWVELHTKRAKQSSIAEISLKNNFFNAFKELKESSDDGLVNKGDLFNLVGQKVGKSNMQVSRDWKKISNLFVETKDGRKKFVEIREGAEE
jgi:Ni2+-binding GTPase involved in maturation of urease and hydrogenase